MGSSVRGDGAGYSSVCYGGWRCDNRGSGADATCVANPYSIPPYDKLDHENLLTDRVVYVEVKVVTFPGNRRLAL